HRERVLDVACGDGYLLELLVRRFPGARFTGVDASAQELQMARERTALRDVALIEARVEAMPIDTGAMDAVVCHMALMLFDDARSVVREVARVLPGDGMFAAVLGPAPGAGSQLRDYGAKLRELEREAGCSPLDVGDDATASAASLRDLFEPAVWREPDIADTTVQLCDPKDVHGMLMSMYNVARLPESGRLELSSYLCDRLDAARSPFEPADWAMGLRHVVAYRA
ncbi:MAG TPA: class I SAM-dependent methyltransferase, partial [Candidatus Tumulicola sp.]